MTACTAPMPDFVLLTELKTGPDRPFLIVLNLISSDARSSSSFSTSARVFGTAGDTVNESISNNLRQLLGRTWRSGLWLGRKYIEDSTVSLS